MQIDHLGHEGDDPHRRNADRNVDSQAPWFASSITLNVRNTLPLYSVSRMKSSAHTTFIRGTRSTADVPVGVAAA